MSLEVKIPKDIREYKEKIIMGMNLKQLICLLSAVLVNVILSYVFIYKLKISMDIMSWVMILSSLPILSIGWVKYRTISCKEIFVIFIRYHIMPGRMGKGEKEILSKKEKVEPSKRRR